MSSAMAQHRNITHSFRWIKPNSFCTSVCSVAGMSQVYQHQLGDTGGQHVEQVARAACTVLRPSAQEELQESRGGRAGGYTQPSGM